MSTIIVVASHPWEKIRKYTGNNVRLSSCWLDQESYFCPEFCPALIIRLNHWTTKYYQVDTLQYNLLGDNIQSSHQTNSVIALEPVIVLKGEDWSQTTHIILVSGRVLYTENILFHLCLFLSVKSASLAEFRKDKSLQSLCFLDKRFYLLLKLEERRLYRDRK